MTLVTPACHNLPSQRDKTAKSRPRVHLKAITAQTRLVVTICLYLRWKNRAAYRSKHIAAKLKCEVVVNTDPVTTNDLWSGHFTMSGWIARRKRNAANWGATTEPAPRSVITREQSRSLDGRRMDVTRRIANRTTRLVTVATTASGTYKAAFTKYGSELSKLSKRTFEKGGHSRRPPCVSAVALPWPVDWLDGKEEL